MSIEIEATKAGVQINVRSGKNSHFDSSNIYMNGFYKNV